MQAPGIIGNEAERIASLHSLNILDSAAEERFDRLTRLAHRLLKVPVSLISLVDSERLWFKSSQGLEVSEISREMSFCRHALIDQKPFIVTDARQDSRFANNPLVTGPCGIIFYAGIPLRGSDGQTLGSFAVIDRQPRFLSRDALDTLEDLAAIAERELRLSFLETTDPYTGLCNRKGFKLLAPKIISACAREGKPATALFLRITGLETLAENISEYAANLVIDNFSTFIHEINASPHISARLNHNNFVILLAHADDLQAHAVYEEFRAHFQQLDIGKRFNCHVNIQSRTHPFSSGTTTNVEAQLQQGASAFQPGTVQPQWSQMERAQC